MAIFSQLTLYFWLYTHLCWKKNNVNMTWALLIVELLGSFAVSKCQRENPLRRQGLIMSCKLFAINKVQYVSCFVSGFPRVAGVGVQTWSSFGCWYHVPECPGVLSHSAVSNEACLASLAAESSLSLQLRCHFLPTVGNSSQMVLGWHLAPAKIDVV